MSSKLINIGIIGIGSIFNSYLKIIKLNKRISLKAISSRTESKLTSISKKHKIPKVYTNYKLMIEKENLDAVFILVSADQIFKVTKSLLKYQIPLLIEKPPGLSFEESSVLANLSKKYNTKNMVGLNRRFYSNFHKGIEVINRYGGIQNIIIEGHERFWKIKDNITKKQRDLIDRTLEYNEKLHEQETGMANINAVHNAYLETQEKVLEQNDRQVGSIESMSRAYETLNEKVLENIGFEEARMRSMQIAFDEDTKRAERQKKDSKDNLDAFKQGKFGEIDMQKLTNKQMGQMGRQALAEGAKTSKKMFKLNQALAIGEAIMNTAQGVTNALKLPFPINIVMAGLVGAMGAAQISTIRSQQPPAQFGGSRLPNSPFLVGEKGPELFTPNTAGSVTPNHQLGGGGATVNFNITTVDASSFGALLDTRRGQIVNMINSALNNKGQAALV